MAWSPTNAVKNNANGHPIFYSPEEIWQGALNANQNAIRVEIAPPTGAVGNKAAFVRGVKAPAAINTPEALAAAGTYVTTVTIWGLRNNRAMNADMVYIDSANANDTQFVPILPGTFITITAPPGKVIDLGELYVDSLTLTDGVFFLGML